ncbi:penicillin-binding protein 2 [Elioraea sp.]|jgi:penicillin-binding protein 2|uniref:penicillin-binding protein 2 n=1 Tax=Elioraea sp. TaxID=2185103 RepID=UPI0021DEA868|nr:penicillin-binding protein 2 [Elioraea sp.]GIX10612.1 MAG: peptidoglycan glycosyltransferase [Elioraea sp.]
MRREQGRRAVFTRRMLLVGAGQVAIMGAMGARLYQLQVVESDRYKTLAEENRISVRLIPPPRGRLTDRFGEPIAANRQNWRAMLVAERTDDVGATLATFAEIVPLTEADRARVERELRRRRRFVPVVVRDHLDWEEMARLEVNAPDLPGIMTDVGQSRIYPGGEAFAHVVGYVAPPAEADLDGDPMLELPGIRVGRAGLERAHDQALRGRAGSVRLEVNAVGRVIRELAREEGTPGQDVTTTLDAGLQQFAAARIAEESAAAVVLDARNGEVMAMVSSPSFDPSLFDTGVSAAQWREWATNPRAPLINKAIAGLYAPGSTFKMVVALAALEARVVSPGERIFCAGVTELGDARFHCWKRGGHGWLDMREAIKQSCDCYFYEIAKRTGIDRIAAMANRFGLGLQPPIELPGARAGLIPTRAWKRATQGVAWQQGETLVHGIGQGFIQTTPLQLAVMTARLVNGGRAVEPHLTRAIGGVPAPGGNAGDWPLIGVPEAHLRLMRDAMAGVVNERGGTAYASRLPAEIGAEMGGKTGTTQVRRITMAERERGLRRQQDLPYEWRHHALFVGFAPSQDPVYACAVIIEHGGGGSAAAAPVARDIMAETLRRDPARRQVPPRPALQVAAAERSGR